MSGIIQRKITENMRGMKRFIYIGGKKIVLYMALVDITNCIAS